MTEQPNASAKPKATTAHAPIDLETIKDDLNIPPTDTSNDAWLQRRVDEIWARMEMFTSRKLVSPPASFVDDWGEIMFNGVHINLPPAIAYWPTASVFLRVYPVVDITGLNINGADTDASHVTFDAVSGKLLGIDAQTVPGVWYEGRHTLGRRLLYERARVTYTAGFATLPPDLYACVLGSLTPLWQARSAQKAGFGGGAITQVDVMDVGSVQLASANAFVEASIKGQKSPDPMLGPWANNLTDYFDWRATLGSEAFATTSDAP